MYILTNNIVFNIYFCIFIYTIKIRIIKCFSNYRYISYIYLG